MRQETILLASIFIFQGCVFDSVTKLEPDAEKINIVTDVDKPTDCRVLGKITGSSHAGDQKKARKGAENEFRNQALKLKANFALIETDRGGPVGTTTQQEVYLTGKALFCHTPEMEAAEEEAREKAQKEKEEREVKEQEEKERKEAEAKAKREEEKEKDKDKDKDKKD